MHRTEDNGPKNKINELIKLIAEVPGVARGKIIILKNKILNFKKRILIVEKKLFDYF